MVNLWFGAAWIAMGLVWFRKAYVGEKYAVITTLVRPEGQPYSKWERTIATLLGIGNVALGIANIWVGLHRGS
jgi:hypothetical protein